MTSARLPSSAALPVLLLADWKNPIVINPEWATDIAVTQGGIESRRGLIGKPYRTLNASFVGLGEGGARAAFQALLEASEYEVEVPLWPDATHLETPTTIGATALAASTAHRRFTVGAKIVIAHPRGDSVAWDFETAVVQSLTSSSITLASGLTKAWPANSRIYPCLLCEVSNKSRVEVLTREIGRGETLFTEKFSATGLGAAETPGTTPAFCDSFAGLPIFPLRVDWTQVTAAVDQDASSTVVGLSGIQQLFGAPRVVFQPPFFEWSRALAFQAVRFFDSRAGRLFPFWLPSPISEAKASAITLTTVTLKGKHLDSVALLNKHIAFKLKGKELSCHRVTSVSGDTLTFSPALDPSVLLSDIEVIVRLWLVRFDSDSLLENWTTTRHLKATFNLRSLQTILDAEDSGSIPYVPDSGKAGDPGQWVVDGSCKAEAPIDPLPMFTADCDCKDPNRPMFRAADFKAPNAFEVTFPRIVRNMSLLGNASEALRSILASRTFRCNYTSSNTGVSRHWHHLRWDGSTWDLQEPIPVERHFWDNEFEYSDDNGNTRTALVRIVAELSTDPDKGMHGVAWMIYAFSDERDPYVDGDPYDNSGIWTTPVEFSYDDPAVWEPTDSEKRCHPYLFICAHVPTTMESSCGFSHVDTDPTVGDSILCNDIDPGLPWSTGTAAPDQPDENVVFGHGTGYEYAAFTLGGGCPTSEIFDYVTVEDSCALFKGTEPTWDQDRARLLFVDPVVILTPCTPDQDSLACCDGHPSSPNMGSPQCWSSIGIAGFRSGCCFDLTRPLVLRLTQRLQRVSRCVDAGGLQTTYEIECTEGVTRDLEVPVYEVDFADQSANFPTSQDLRQVVWKLWKADPTATPENYYSTFSGVDPPDTADFAQDDGVWTMGAGQANVTTNARSLLRLTDYGSYKNFEARIAVGDPTKNYGMFFRSTSSVPLTGLQVKVDVSAKTVGLYKWTADVWEAIAFSAFTETPLAGYTFAVRIVDDLFECWTEESAGIDLGRGYPRLDQRICYPTSGSVGIWAEEAGQFFTEFDIVDLLPPQVTLTVTFDKDGWHLAFDKAFWPSYDLYPTGSYDTNPTCSVSCCREIGEYLPNVDIAADMSGTLGSDWGCGSDPNGSTLTEIGPCGGFPAVQMFPPYSTCLSANAPCCGSGDGTGYWQWAGSVVAVKS